MIPETFREFDRVAHEAFDFLVSEKGCAGPFVEFGRDYSLAYQMDDGLIIRVGVERGGLVLPRLMMEYRDAPPWVAGFRSLRTRLGIPLDSSRFPHLGSFLQASSELQGLRMRFTKKAHFDLEWPSYLSELARLLREHFEETIELVHRLRLDEKNTRQPGPFDDLLFWIPRDEFWRVRRRGYRPSTVPMTCPSCGFSDTVSVTDTVAGRNLKVARYLVGALYFIAFFTLAFDTWPGTTYGWPMVGLAVVSGYGLMAARKWIVGVEYTCPECGHRARDFETADP